jgi:hypothetical protein
MPIIVLFPGTMFEEMAVDLVHDTPVTFYGVCSVIAYNILFMILFFDPRLNDARPST